MQQTGTDPRDAEPQVSEVEAIKAFFARYGNSMVFTLLVVVAVAVGVTGYRRWLHGKVERATRELGTASTVQDLEAIVERYPQTAAASVALLRLAKEQYNLGGYDMALEKYEEFLRAYPEHRLVLAAELGKVHCLEARGQVREALEGFRTFAGRHPDHFLSPQAVLGQARCLQELGNLEAARIVCEDFIAEHPDSLWQGRVQEELEELERESERAAGGGAVPLAGP